LETKETDHLSIVSTAHK